jgi:anti-sigma factor RsiW
MTCPSVCAKLAAYQDGDLRADQARAVEAHLLTCASCARELRELRGVVTLLEGLDELEPSAGFTAGVLKIVAQEPVAEPTQPLLRTGLTLAGVGLALSALILAGLAGWGPLDLSAWQPALASLLTATAKLAATACAAAEPVLGALLEGLARPVGWLLVADVVLLAAVLAGARRFLTGRGWRNLTNVWAL